MKLSIVIVNYNVKHFLEQCLKSVYQAIQNIEAEIFVVDNNSVDGSQEMVRSSFPEVNLISNAKNTGFSKANNQAIKKRISIRYFLVSCIILVKFIVTTKTDKIKNWTSKNSHPKTIQ